MPVLLEEIYLHPVLFKGIENMDLKWRSLSQVVDSSFYMRPTGGRQTFRITNPDAAKRSTPWNLKKILHYWKFTVF
jgi:GntR family transcriptional regulator